MPPLQQSCSMSVILNGFPCLLGGGQYSHKRSTINIVKEPNRRRGASVRFHCYNLADGLVAGLVPHANPDIEMKNTDFRCLDKCTLTRPFTYVAELYGGNCSLHGERARPCSFTQL